MKKLLRPPCFYCEYDGDDYWERRSHDKDCPFSGLEGEAQRLKVLPFLLKKWAIIIKHFGSQEVEREKL